MAKPESFSFGANVRQKKTKGAKAGKGKKNAWQSYTGSKKR